MDKDIKIFGPGGHKCRCCKRLRCETRTARQREAIRDGVFDQGGSYHVR